MLPAWEIKMLEAELEKRKQERGVKDNEAITRLAEYEDSGLSPEEVQELAKAKADGRLVVLPCKVGTRVWVIGQDCDLCHDMYTEEPCLFGDCEYKGVFESIFSIGMTDKFGKTVFLTREEAEKAIGGKEDG
jgi:hypothetical protein